MGLRGLTLGVAQASQQWPAAMAQRWQMQQQQEQQAQAAQQHQEAQDNQFRDEALQRLNLVQEYVGRGQTQLAKDLFEQTINNPQWSRFIPEPLKLQYEALKNPPPAPIAPLAGANPAISRIMPGRAALRPPAMATPQTSMQMGAPPALPTPTAPPPNPMEAIFGRGKNLQPVPSKPGYFYDPGTGAITETPQAAQWSESTKKVNKIFPEAGIMFFEDGSTQYLTPEIRRSLAAESGGRKIIHWDTENNRAFYDDGSVKQLPLPEGGRRIDPKAVSTAYNVVLNKVQSAQNPIPPDQAADEFKKTLLMSGASEEDATKQTNVVRPDLMRYAMKVALSNKEDADLANAISVMNTMDQLHQMVADPELQGDVGRISGQRNRLLKNLSGGAAVSPKYTEFLTVLNNMKDLNFQRVRSGAVLSPTEEKFYNDLLGSDVTDWRALQKKFDTFINILNQGTRSIYEAGLIRKYGAERWPDLRESMLKQVPVHRKSWEIVPAGMTGMTNEDLLGAPADTTR